MGTGSLLPEQHFMHALSTTSQNSPLQDRCARTLLV